MSKQWVLRKEVSKNLLEQILFYKDIKTPDETDRFLNRDYEKELGDPFDILNMDKAVERILRAVKENERVIIFGDYDADGVCSSAIFHDFFKKIGFANFHVHIPDRNFEGYGLSNDAIDEFVEQKAKLIITLDCGITDCDEVEKANENGVDVVIIDHHIVPFSTESEKERPPNALAIIDSKQEKDAYPFKFLCGAGVAFKVIQALVARGCASGEFKIIPGWEKWLLDAVAIATVADMVSLTGENRALVFYGLEVLKKTQRPGLIAFYKKFSIDSKNITEGDIAFTIVPRINVASRLGHANTSFELMTTSSSEEGKWISSHLDTLNNDRKKAVDDVMNDIEKILNNKIPDVDVIVVGDMGWHPGILGIAANRILDKYEKPVFLWGRGESNGIKGSCRSKGSVNLVDLMRALPKEILTEQGGHAKAGGFSVAEDRIKDFETEIRKAHKNIEKQEIENGILHIDAEMAIEDVNWNTWATIEKLRPFGIDNPSPVFMFSGLEIFNVRKFGNGGIHLGLDFKNSAGKKISAIGFFIANNEKFNLLVGQRIDLAASIEKSTFRGIIELRLRIVDIRKTK